MNEVWEALTANVNVVSLLAEGLPPKAASTWYTPAWASLMGRLEELEISMWYGDNGAGWMSNTLENYIDFESRRLREYFLQHCRRLRRLRLVAGPQTGFGDASGLDNFNGPLPLEQGDLPALRRLELKNLFVSEQLALFILRTDEAERSGQAESGDKSDRECNQDQEERIPGPCEALRSLQVLNCHVHPRSTIGTWAVFFDMLRTGQQAGGRRHGRHELCELDVTYRYGSETIPWVHSHDEAPWAWTVDRDTHGADVTGDSEPGEPEEDERVLAIRSSERCAFSYALPTDKYGDVWLCCDELFQAFERGNDYRAYAALMDSVERNRVKGGSRDSGE
ncbi:hypothetical protein Micbo1qcDRAFT_159780 [Microdochium bolleyi]|uniref:F-box domain-containing protein n=1 Tax=Microdochium bolleyi TaxID=196109 RepID=A0A136JBU5_9PEZI|nr:hypothetical protein Micbo1qcDRAFT_159780 [Microdochium bolleyi]